MATTNGPELGAKPDEIKLWNSFGEGTDYMWPRDAGRALGMHPKRVDYLCAKWSVQGIYEYGVTIDLGWKDV